MRGRNCRVVSNSSVPRRRIENVLYHESKDHTEVNPYTRQLCGVRNWPDLPISWPLNKYVNIRAEEKLNES